jgi:hypothetical protein
MQYMDFQNGYQQFLDYQKYMQWQGAGSSTGGAADYEQYMDYQNDYQQFLKYQRFLDYQNDSQFQNDYQQFLDYRYYMNFATSGTAAGKDVAADSTTGTTLMTRLRVLRCKGARRRTETIKVNLVLRTHLDFPPPTRCGCMNGRRQCREAAIGLTDPPRCNDCVSLYGGVCACDCFGCIDERDRYAVPEPILVPAVQQLEAFEKAGVSSQTSPG